MVVMANVFYDMSDGVSRGQGRELRPYAESEWGGLYILRSISLFTP